MGFVHVFGVNVDIGFIVFAITVICAIAISIGIAMMKEKYIGNTDSDDDNFVNRNFIDYSNFNQDTSPDHIDDPAYYFLGCNVYHSDDD